MARYRHRLSIHLHCARVNNDDSACSDNHCPRSEHQQTILRVPHAVNIRSGVCSRAFCLWTLVRDLWAEKCAAAFQSGVSCFQYRLRLCEDGTTVDCVSLFCRIWREVRAITFMVSSESPFSPDFVR